MREHAEYRDLLPGHALGCLDYEEELALRDHLRGCASCREELGALGVVVGELAATIAPARPPAALEGRILARAGQEGPLPSRAPVGATLRRRTALLLAATALVAGLGLGLLFQQLPTSSRQASGVDGLQTLAFVGQGPKERAFGTMVIDPEDEEGVVAVRGLGSLDSTRKYQLWLVKGSRRVSGGLFGVDAHGYGSLLLEVPRDLDGFDSFFVTIEPASGSPSPTGRAVMEGRR